MNQAKIRTMVVTGIWDENNRTDIPDSIRFQGIEGVYQVITRQPPPQFNKVMVALEKVINGYTYGGTKK